MWMFQATAQGWSMEGFLKIYQSCSILFVGLSFLLLPKIISEGIHSEYAVMDCIKHLDLFYNQYPMKTQPFSSVAVALQDRTILCHSLSFSWI